MQKQRINTAFISNNFDIIWLRKTCVNILFDKCLRKNVSKEEIEYYDKYIDERKFTIQGIESRDLNTFRSKEGHDIEILFFPVDTKYKTTEKFSLSRLNPHNLEIGWDFINEKGQKFPQYFEISVKYQCNKQGKFNYKLIHEISFSTINDGRKENYKIYFYEENDAKKRKREEEEDEKEEQKVKQTRFECAACKDSRWWNRETGNENKISRLYDMNIKHEEIEAIIDFQRGFINQPPIPCYCCNTDGKISHQNVNIITNNNFWENFSYHEKESKEE